MTSSAADTRAALALPAELAAELAGLEHLAFTERVLRINQGLRSRYINRLAPIRMTQAVLWSQLADQINRQCDAFIMAANPPDARGWAGGCPVAL